MSTPMPVLVTYSVAVDTTPCYHEVDQLVETTAVTATSWNHHVGMRHLPMDYPIAGILFSAPDVLVDARHD